MNLGLTPDELLGQATVPAGLSPPASRSVRQAFVAVAPECKTADLLSPGEQNEVASERLAEQAKAGCFDSFEQLVTRHQNQIFNFLRQFAGNHHDAQDLTQETFVKAYRNLYRYNPSFSFAAWLFTIARRTAASHFRSARRFEELPAGEESKEASPATALESKDERNSIWRLVRTLKPNQAEALWWRYAEGFSVAETARIMRTNQIHIKVLLHRARSNMSKILTKRGLGLEIREGIKGLL